MQLAKSNKPVLFIIIFVLLVVVFYFLFSDRPAEAGYPYQANYQKYSSHSSTYNIAIVSDMDKSSKQDNFWKSSIIYGVLERGPSGTYSVQWTRERILKSQLNEGGRSMELSDLCNFGDKLYSFDDRTGMVVVIEEDKAYPVALLMDGNGRNDKGFKGEWCSVKDGKLFIGGMGKEWTDQSGNFVNNNPLWVKTLDLHGAVSHFDWYNNYNSLKEAAGIKSPGYLLNEAAVWVPSESIWMFLPRRVSKEKYDAVLDEYRCSNIGLAATSDFTAVYQVDNIGPLKQTRGFSSMKFIPWRENEIVVLKTEEIGETNTYIMVYDLNEKKILMEETIIPYHLKFEGIEFL